MAFVPYREVRRGHGRNQSIKPLRSNNHTSVPNITRHMTGGLGALVDRIRAIQKAEQQLNIQNQSNNKPNNFANNQSNNQPNNLFTSNDGRPVLSEQPPPVQPDIQTNNPSANQSSKGEWTRADGHLSISPSLPLLNRRYRVLHTVGEGTFSQLVLAEDTFTQLPSTSHSNNQPNNNQSVNPPETPSQASTNQLKSLSISTNIQSPKPVSSQPRIDPHAPSNYKRVAVKVMNSKYSFIGVQEVDKLCWLNGRDPRSESHIVRLIGAFYFDNHLCLVLELLGPSLLSLIKSGISSQPGSQPSNQRHRVPLDSIRKICWQLCLSLSFVASCAMIHGDVKPENVLLTSAQPASRSVNVKLIDFGNAMTGAESLLYFDDFDVQTLYYRAPEVLLGLGFGPPIDMWSLGCVAVELATGRPLFHCANNAELFDAMLTTLGPMPKQPFQQGKFASKFLTQPHHTYSTSPNQSTNSAFLSSMGHQPGVVSAPAYDTHSHARMNTLATLLGTRDRDFVSFICGLLEYDPAQRLTATSALFHPFFARLTPMTMLFGDPKNVMPACLRVAANNTKQQPNNQSNNQSNMNSGERYLVPIQAPQQMMPAMTQPLNQTLNQTMAPSIFSSMRGPPVIYGSPHSQPMSFSQQIQPINPSLYANMSQTMNHSMTQPMSQPLTQSFINQSMMNTMQAPPQTFTLNDRRVMLQQMVAPQTSFAPMQPMLITQPSINQSMNQTMETYYPTALNTFFAGPTNTPIFTARPPPANPKLVPPSPDFTYNTMALSSPLLSHQMINQSMNQMNQSLNSAMNQSINSSMNLSMNPFVSSAGSPPHSHTRAAQQQSLVDNSLIDMQALNQSMNRANQMSPATLIPRKLSVNTNNQSSSQLINQTMHQQPMNGYAQPTQYMSSPQMTSQAINQSMNQINQSFIPLNPDEDSPLNRLLSQRKRKIDPPAASMSTGGLKRRLNHEDELPPRSVQSQRHSPR